MKDSDRIGWAFLKEARVAARSPGEAPKSERLKMLEDARVCKEARRGLLESPRGLKEA